MKITGGNVKLRGEITVPGDKSISHRAVMFGAIAEDDTIIKNFLMGNDCLSTVQCFRDLGVEIDIQDNIVKVKGVGLKGLKRPKKILNVGNSGTTIRLLSGILAGQNFISHITGDDSIQKRPMDRIITPLRKMGASIKGVDDKYAPLQIEPADNLKGITYRQPVASAQVKSCIMLAGLYADGITRVIQPSISRDHTERMLNYFEYDVVIKGKHVILNKTTKLKGKEIIVPGDISSAAFFIVGALILKGSRIVIKQVGLNPTRTGVIDALKKMGGNIKIVNYRFVNNEPIGDIFVEYSQLKGIEISGDLIPRLIDEIPVLAVAASVAEGTTIIRNAEELKVKESNRITAVVNELKKMNVDIEELDDGMIIKGSKNIQTANLDTYKDHRITMALTILALYAKGESIINNTESVSISFPKFYEVLGEIIT
ncbi:3-phosphoshikimate 1-carboxyvinyltransferase [Caldisalinibacter kiritimatiensis]|uniref:3-phosphoshikimate 1-carboxyvinyltransferase n=1 Tax=Caldisalinibacter kiritimatiensis TaxID=1304284 RepID=R1AXF4_9FIRM|nr:3-phosphoshikimate 1-carboxyvinyltransferase [Caldisalinibacter kiritimatiensis]EOD01337.1 5-Enolpyruvylshikimate-3-phosphate synthase [Caldisalinibacter kiritimatiensis]